MNMMSTILQRFFKFLYFLLVCITPFLFSSRFTASFEYPKFIFSIIVIEILSTVFWIINESPRSALRAQSKAFIHGSNMPWFSALYDNLRIKKTSVDMWDMLALCWVLVLVGASWRAGTLDYSFLGSPFRYQGIFTQIHVVVLFFITRRLVGLIPDFRSFILKLSIGGALVQSIFILLQWMQVNLFSLDVTTYSGRVFGTFGEPNFAAGYLAVGVGSLFGITKRLSYRNVMVLSIMSLAILATRSWGGILACVAVGCFYFWQRLKTREIKVLFLILTGIAFIIFIFLGLDKEKITIQSNGFPRIESRLSIWPQSLKLFLKRPFIGYGAENLNLVFPDEFGGVFIDRAHNAFLDALISGGIFLGALYLAFVGIGLTKAYGESSPFIFPFITIITRDMVNVSSIVNLVIFWLILGLIFVIEKRKI